MGVTVYSLVISVLFFNLALVAAFIMRRSSFLARHTVSFLLLMVLLGIIRLLTPIDFDKAFVVRSYQVVPRMEAFLKQPVMGTLSLGSLLVGIWMIGTTVIITVDAVREFRFIHKSRNYPPSDRRDLLDLAAEQGCDFGLLVSSSISRPYVAGLFRPVIYLPDIELPEAQWRTVFRHEVQHIRSHDEWKKLFFAAVQALFWWNPLAQISCKEIDTLIELQCDAKVTAGMSEEEVDTYLETLKALMERTRDRCLAITAAAMVWNGKQMEARFKALGNAGATEKKRPPIAVYVLLTLTFLSSYMVLVQPAYAPQEEELTSYHNGHFTVDRTQEIKEAESIQIVREDGEYVMYVNGKYHGVLDEDIFSDPENSNPIFNSSITGGD